MRQDDQLVQKRHTWHRGALGLLGATLLAAVSIFFVPLDQATAAPMLARECACVEYVRAAWKVWDGLPSPGHAYFMAQNNWFVNQQFKQVQQPEQWAAVIFEKGWGGLDEDSGHAALVAKWESRSSGWKITMRGANQHYSDYRDKDGNFKFWEEYDCNNVSDATLGAIVTWDDIKNNRVTFWMPNTPRW